MYKYCKRTATQTMSIPSERQSKRVSVLLVGPLAPQVLGGKEGREGREEGGGGGEDNSPIR